MDGGRWRHRQQATPEAGQQEVRRAAGEPAADPGRTVAGAGVPGRVFLVRAAAGEGRTGPGVLGLAGRVVPAGILGRGAARAALQGAAGHLRGSVVDLGVEEEGEFSPSKM